MNLLYKVPIYERSQCHRCMYVSLLCRFLGHMPKDYLRKGRRKKIEPFPPSGYISNISIGPDMNARMPFILCSLYCLFVTTMATRSRGTSIDTEDRSLIKRMERIWIDNGHGQNCVCDECNVMIQRDLRPSERVDNFVTKFACMPCLGCVDVCTTAITHKASEESRNEQIRDIIRKRKEAKERARALASKNNKANRTSSAS